MAEESLSSPQTRKYAVVTGGNKGIGYEICKQLMNKGVIVVLTARDEERGKEAVQKLITESSSSSSLNQVVFHQLDVVDPASVSSLLHFIQSNYGKLDILVNNAGINGLMVEGDVSILPELIERDASRGLSNTTTEEDEAPIKSNGKLIETYEWGEECIATNYYGAKRMVEAFIPLLLLSPLPRVVNVSSLLGKLKLVSNEWAIKALSNVDSLTAEKVDEVVNEFLTDFKKGSLKEKGWPTDMAAYKISKAALNAYTRLLAQKYSSICVNCICPGFTKTDITCNTGPLTPEEAAENPVNLALLPEDGPSGHYFFRNTVLSAF